MFFLYPSLTEFDRIASHNRMKLCEALVRSLSMCGQILPVYREELLDAFLCGVRDEDELIRASSLSGIGELCGLLNFSIGSIIVEVGNQFSGADLDNTTVRWRLICFYKDISVIILHSIVVF